MKVGSKHSIVLVTCGKIRSLEYRQYILYMMGAHHRLPSPSHPLGGLALSSGSAAKPGRREDALAGAPVQVGEGFCRIAKLLVSSESKGAFGQFL